MGVVFDWRINTNIIIVIYRIINIQIGGWDLVQSGSLGGIYTINTG